MKKKLKHPITYESSLHLTVVKILTFPQFGVTKHQSIH